jgi:hypothetical protein
MNTPNLDKMLNDALDKAEIDTPEWNAFDDASTELYELKEALVVSKREHKATSDALYHLQFVQHEELLNKYCALRDAMKALVEGMGYTVKPK